jgi:NAD-dependent deacetylase
MMKKIMIISGAGLSAESGISTFRDHDGLWENYDVMQVCSTQGWRDDRELVTQFYNDRRRDLRDKVPNKAHQILAMLEKKYPGQILHLTQNIDNLMEKAGAKEIIHLHGTLTDLRCESCGHVWDIGYDEQNEHDACPSCESDRVRHNVVMFGEAAPNYQRIYEAISQSELFIAIGTSGQVIDIVALANEFHHSILINPKREEYITAFGSFDKKIDEYFEHFIQKGASDAMEELEVLMDEFLVDD